MVIVSSVANSSALSALSLKPLSSVLFLEFLPVALEKASETQSVISSVSRHVFNLETVPLADRRKSLRLFTSLALT